MSDIPYARDFDSLKGRVGQEVRAVFGIPRTDSEGRTKLRMLTSFVSVVAIGKGYKQGSGGSLEIIDAPDSVILAHGSGEDTVNIEYTKGQFFIDAMWLASGRRPRTS